MTLPKLQVFLIVAADEPALFFSSAEAAEQYLEPIDVEGRVYGPSYGTAGEPYQIAVERGRVVVRLDNAKAAQPDELKALLLRFLAGIGVSVSTDEDLPTLLIRCTAHITC